MTEATPATPYYIVYEDRLRRNLELISHVSHEADVEIIMALKANALWKTFPIIREYITSSTASSLNEMRLSNDYLGGGVHTYCPVYREVDMPAFLAGSSHITFNSVAQYERHRPTLQSYNALHPEDRVSPGLRVNPRCSVVETDIYNPCLPGSRFGVEPDALASGLPDGIEGLHFHALCESDSYDLEKVLAALESQYGHLLGKIKWLNMGGGHLMTREGYDTEHLISVLKGMHTRYPGLRLIMEPGSAFTWRTGDLITSVLDVVENAGIRTAIIDASFACHMPDCLEMPYKPAVTESNATGKWRYRLGGNSCLSGDYVSDWGFDSPLLEGDVLTLEDMNHYTNVKTNMFNGIQHPDVWLCRSDGHMELLRHYDYADYRDRMD